MGEEAEDPPEQTLIARADVVEQKVSKDLVALPSAATRRWSGEIDPGTAKLLAKFVNINQHTNNSHWPMTAEKLVNMLLEDVAASA